MKLTITTLVIVEGSYIQGIFHSLEEHPGKAYQELVDQVENEYGYDADKDHVSLHFKTIQDIKNYFELVHIETQELRYQGCTQILYHCQILWMGTKRGRPRGNHFQYTLFRYPRR